MKTKDYYKTLNINENATESEIKSAYRKLARTHHPDIAGASPANVQLFKDINEAYETLIDRKKRYEYDAIRRLYSYATKNNTTEPPKEKTQSHKNPQEKKNPFWEEFLKYQHQKETNSNPAPQDGTDITTDVSITYAEANNGTQKRINILHTKVCESCKGRKFVNGCQCKTCNGTGSVSEHKKLTVKIPPNVKNGYKIRIAGEGNQGLHGGKNGNLYLIIKIEKSFDFKYDGVNIYRTVPITPFEAVLGASIELSVPDGKITMKILPNTNSGQKFRLQGQGLSKNGVTGDLIVTVEIKIPEKISEEERELYKKLAQLNSTNIRKVF